MAKDKSSIASVLAFEKKLVFSDAYMYGTTWDERTSGVASPLSLTEKSVRGTISNRLDKATGDDPAKLNAKVEQPNLQRVDGCSLGMEQDTLKVCFTLKVLSGIDTPSACNNAEFLKKYREVAKAYVEKYGFKELASRYAENLANARFLWRNRLGAEQLEVHVVSEGRTWEFMPYNYSLREFSEEKDASIEELAGLIANALCGKRPSLFITVEAYAKLGVGQEVYPSEELVFDKDKNSKSDKNNKGKVLYAVNGVAAMHSQKIGNAVRTVDTWYPAYDTEDGVGPIAAEPYGAVTTLGKAFRSPKEKVDFYTLFDKYAVGTALDNAEQEHYVMAVIVRGGVFGQSSKE